MSEEKYYISGYSYIPSEDTLLCEVKNEPYSQYESERLYMTEHGAFYVIRVSCEHKEVRILTEREALRFMDQHAACILTENYDSVFGTPERG